MPGHESASAVYSGVLRDTPAGAIAVWVTRNGVRRIGDVTSQMIEEGPGMPTDTARSAPPSTSSVNISTGREGTSIFGSTSPEPPISKGASSSD